MDAADLTNIVDLLKQRGVPLHDGLTDSEVARVESAYGFHFPPDLKVLLQYALPVSPNFPNWRSGPAGSLWRWLQRPAEGIHFDIEANNFWMEAWGARPPTLADALDIAGAEIARAPVLIPVYGHRYLPGEPELSGNPVFSVVQTDIVCYGADLADYFAEEFGHARRGFVNDTFRHIRFWGDIVAANNRVD